VSSQLPPSVSVVFPEDAQGDEETRAKGLAEGGSVGAGTDLEVWLRRSVPHVLDNISQATPGGAKLCSMCHRTGSASGRGTRRGGWALRWACERPGRGPGLSSDLPFTVGHSAARIWSVPPVSAWRVVR